MKKSFKEKILLFFDNTVELLIYSPELLFGYFLGLYVCLKNRKNIICRIEKLKKEGLSPTEIEEDLMIFLEDLVGDALSKKD